MNEKVPKKENNSITKIGNIEFIGNNPSNFKKVIDSIPSEILKEYVFGDGVFYVDDQDIIFENKKEGYSTSIENFVKENKNNGGVEEVAIKENHGGPKKHEDSATSQDEVGGNAPERESSNSENHKNPEGPFKEGEGALHSPEYAHEAIKPIEVVKYVNENGEEYQFDPSGMDKTQPDTVVDIYDQNGNFMRRELADVRFFGGLVARNEGLVGDVKNIQKEIENLEKNKNSMLGKYGEHITVKEHEEINKINNKIDFLNNDFDLMNNRRVETAVSYFEDIYKEDFNEAQKSGNYENVLERILNPYNEEYVGHYDMKGDIFDKRVNNRDLEGVIKYVQSKMDGDGTFLKEASLDEIIEYFQVNKEMEEIENSGMSRWKKYFAKRDVLKNTDSANVGEYLSQKYGVNGMGKNIWNGAKSIAGYAGLGFFGVLGAITFGAVKLWQWTISLGGKLNSLAEDTVGVKGDMKTELFDFLSNPIKTMKGDYKK